MLVRLKLFIVNKKSSSCHLKKKSWRALLSLSSLKKDPEEIQAHNVNIGIHLSHEFVLCKLHPRLLQLGPSHLSILEMHRLSWGDESAFEIKAYASFALSFDAAHHAGGDLRRAKTASSAGKKPKFLILYARQSASSYKQSFSALGYHWQ